MDKKRFQYLVGQRIRAIRLEKGMEQQELAAKVDMDASNVSRIEYGNTSPTMWTMQKISVALEVSLSELVDLTENSDEESTTKTS